MIPRSLQTIFRTLAEAQAPESDGELLRRFLAGEDAAFAELVRRHGRLVWSVCRQLAGSDSEADDAFQATFLVLLRNAGKIRDGGRLSSWLHGVAYKVCAKARQAAKRRASREQVVAVSERNGSAVSESAWDRALAAVHEEVRSLPETLRVPFVLCCLEGKGVTEAAEQLGWKLGTFSGRLTRAKDAVFARLDARGLTLGVVAGLGLAAPPAAVVARATALAQVGNLVPGSVLQLAQGVIGMSMTSFKMLAVVVLLTGGLALGVGAGGLATADAQPPATSAPPKADPQDEVKLLEALLGKARREAEAQRERAEAAAALARLAAFQEATQRAKAETVTAKTTKWEYDFVVVSDMTTAKFVAFLQDREDRGWEFNGTTPLLQQYKASPVWVFRRPVKGTGTVSPPKVKAADPTASPPGLPVPPAPVKPPAPPAPPTSAKPPAPPAPPAGAKPPAPPAPPASVQALVDFYAASPTLRPSADAPTGLTPPKIDEVKTIESEIAALQARLATLKSWQRAVFMTKDLPLSPAELAPVLKKLAEKKFKVDRFQIAHSENGIAVEGDKEVIEWATALIKKLADK